MMDKRQFLARISALAACAAIPLRVRAASFPDHPVRMVVPYAVGGSADVIARVLAQEMSRLLGQSVIIDPRPGAGGNLGAALVARGTPDGYTILLASLSLSASPSFTKLTFDPRTDLVPIAGIGTLPSALLVGADSPYRTVADVIAASKGGKAMDFGSAGVTTGSHLFGELLKSETGIKMTHVPYRGSGAAYPDLIAGRLTLMFDVMASAIGQVKAGTVRAIAVAAAQRSAALPDVPTLGELGYQGFDTGTWFGIFAPPGTPAEALARLEAATLDAVKAPEVSERLNSFLAEPIPGPGTEFKRWYLADYDRWAALAKTGRIVLSQQ
jgi:tripartite-type tricarboxylate transporter receptor subunit TctC